MSTTPFSVTSNETFTMFDVFVKDAEGKSKEYGFQCGGGRMTAQQAADHIEKFNLYPGAQEVTIKPARSPVPQMSIQRRIEQQAAKGLKQKVFATPKPKPLPKPENLDVATPSQESRNALGDPVQEVVAAEAPPAEPPAPTSKKK